MTTQTNRQRIAHACPSCGCIRRLTPYDAARTTCCRRCHCRQIAPLGFAATAAAYGRDFAIRAAAAKRKERPSALERRVEAALRNVPRIQWEREAEVARPDRASYYVDFAILVGGKRIALEVNGTYAHRHGTDEQRLELLHRCFDAVVVVTEIEVRRTADLSGYLRRLFARTNARLTSHPNAFTASI